METVVKNLERGLKEGVYRQEIDVRVFARLRVIEIEAMFNLQLFKEVDIDLSLVQLHFIDHFVRGLVTEKGLKQWETISENLFKVIRN